MIATALGYGMKEFKSFKKKEVDQYDHIIFGTGVYMGKMKKLKRAKRLFRDKSVTIFACGGNNNVEQDIAKIKSDNFTKEELAFHRFFYLPGGIDRTKLSFFTKILFGFIEKTLDKKADRTRDEDEFLHWLKHPDDFVDEKHIASLVKYVEKL